MQRPCHDTHCRRWYDAKAGRTNKVLATKALACKLDKAAWRVMARNPAYDEKRMFGFEKTKPI